MLKVIGRQQRICYNDSSIGFRILLIWEMFGYVQLLSKIQRNSSGIVRAGRGVLVRVYTHYNSAYTDKRS